MTEVGAQPDGARLSARPSPPSSRAWSPSSAVTDSLGALRRRMDAVTQATWNGAGVVGRGIRTVSSPRGIAGTAVEGMWCAAHLAVYPWGLLTDRHYYRHGYGLDELTPTQRGLVIGDVEAAGTPILLVHGMVDNRSIFTLLRRGLHRRGFGRVVTTNYSPFTNDVRAASAQLAADVEELVADTGYERIHLVGHSLGGLIARYYVQRLGGHERVHTLVTLGTPHLGTKAAYLWPARLGRQLRPGSELMEELTQPAPECTTRFLSYWSDLDQLIVPKRNARVVHPDLQGRNRLVRGVGHMSLPIKGRLVHEITAALSQLDTDGTTLAEGVTALQSRSR